MAVFLAVALWMGLVRAASLVSTNGQQVAIPTWDILSTSSAGTNLTALSKPGVNTSSWYHIPNSRCTVMGCLIDNGVYNESDIFYSTKLNSISQSTFDVPWIYRQEFSLNPAPGQHFFLQTNGITSRADVFLNGNQLANKVLQSGNYGGHIYDITNIVAAGNALAIQAYPTQYLYDFASSFVDWNPYPADNGTGVWRNVTIKQTGSIVLGPLRAVTQLAANLGKSPANVTLKATATNLESQPVAFVATGTVTSPDGSPPLILNQSFTIPAKSTSEITLTAVVQTPSIWWPKQWGGQPLYTANLAATINSTVSDTITRKFGFRTVTSKLNSYNDTLFTVNGQPFQVLGAGYSSDMFLRWDSARFTTQALYMLDMGLNTVRLEGKMEQPELYDITDQLGLMVLPGWECCDKWEAWSYNDNLPSPVPVWSADDYATANASMKHEAAEMQTHPSVLGFLVGSDFWPDDKAAAMYVNGLKEADWQTPVICSANNAGFPAILGPSGMKMAGPYDWVPPNYWYDTEPSSDRLGAAFGFGSEQGAGVGTPELASLKKFLSSSDLDDLWKNRDKGLFHMSTDVSSFHNRTIYNNALWNRYGAPKSLEDYVQKAQIMDYEATRAEYEGFSAFWNAKRPATGVVYWMLNGAWPSLHWALWDWYMRPGGAYFGVKVGSRLETVVYDYMHKSVYLVNHSLDKQGARKVTYDVIDTAGKSVATGSVSTTSEPNTSKSVASLSSALGSIKNAVFLRLVLTDSSGTVISRNVYWVSKSIDTLDWDGSNWYVTYVSKYADFTVLDKMSMANVTATQSTNAAGKAGSGSTVTITLENHSLVPAFFIGLNLVGADGGDITPVAWTDNYLTLWPGEKLDVSVTPGAGSGKPASVLVDGKNVPETSVALA